MFPARATCLPARSQIWAVNAQVVVLPLVPVTARMLGLYRSVAAIAIASKAYSARAKNSISLHTAILRF